MGYHNIAAYRNRTAPSPRGPWVAAGAAFAEDDAAGVGVLPATPADGLAGSASPALAAAPSASPWPAGFPACSSAMNVLIASHIACA